MKIKTSELTGAALDWAVAKAEGMTELTPQPMTDAEAEKMRVPFYLWGTVSNKDKNGNWFTTTEKIEVVRYGVDTSVGATSPSISFIGSDGILCRGSVNMFFKTEAEAKSAAIYESSDHQWDEGGYSPSLDWSQGGPIIERERLWVGYSAVGQSLKLLVMADDVVQCHKRASSPNCSTTGPTILIAAMRCYVLSKLGDTIEIPEELTNVRN